MEGTIEVRGVNLWYRVSGDGPPVVQIHGAGFGHYNFDPATPELSKRFRVIDYDMRGYGASDRPVQHYDMEVWADDLAGLLITWQALSRRFLAEQDAVALADRIQEILRDSNRIEVFTAACQAMCDMDIREWVPRFKSPAVWGEFK